MKRDAEIVRMQQRLTQYCRESHDNSARQVLVRFISDPLRPVTKTNRLRVNPVLVLLFVLAALAAGTFLFFSLGLV